MKKSEIDCSNCGAANPAEYTFCHCCLVQPAGAKAARAPKKIAAKKSKAKK